MEKIEINKYHLKKFEVLKTSRFVRMTEGMIYLYPVKNGNDVEEKVIKKFFLEPLENKLKVIETLDDNRYSLLRYNELVLPETIITSGGEPYAIVLRYVPGMNFSDYLVDENIPNNQKIQRFKEIGNFLNIMSEFRKYDKQLSNFYLGDIHSSNFLVNNDRIKIIDLDSCTIGDCVPSMSNYLSGNHLLAEFSPKYEFLNGDRRIMKSSTDTELYCYSMMLLSFLAKSNVSKLSIPEYYEYINYLNSIGLDSEMCDIFRCLYTYKENEDFHELLNISDNVINHASYDEFERIRK